MKYFYDRKSDSLYLTLADRPYGDSVEVVPGVVLDFDKGGRLVGIDLERASKTIDVSDLAMNEQPAGMDAQVARVDGASLKRDREALGLSQTELGRKLSVSSNTIARWERGELKIEHPAMLQLAIAALRSKPMHQTDRVAPAPHLVKTVRSPADARIGRSSRSTRSSSEQERAKKK